MDHLKWLMVVPALLFIAASGFMNFQFAESLGVDATSIWCWRLVSIGVTLSTAGLWHLALTNWRAGEYFRCLAAIIFLSAALTYDVLAAYGFAHKQHIEVTAKDADAKRRWVDADAAVKSLTADLEPFKSAAPLAISKDEVDRLTMQIQLIDDTPDLKVKGRICVREPERAVELRLCPQRARLVNALADAHTRLAESAERAKLETKLEVARTTLNATPLPPAGDIRSQLIGSRLTEWLPVILLTLGATLGLIAIPPSASAKHHNPPKIVTPAILGPSPRSTPPPAHDKPSVPAYEAPKTLATSSDGTSLMIRRLASVTADTPAGLIVTRDGWIHGTQRQLARAAGFPNTTAFHNAMHAAAGNGELEIDTSSGRTAIRLLEQV